MDLNNIHSNILLHAGGKVGTHRFLDLLMLNNSNLTVKIPGTAIPFFEQHHIVEWRANPEQRKIDLNTINQQGKNWIIKTGGVPDITDSLMQQMNFQNCLEIVLVRENISDIVASATLAIINNWTFHIHTTDEIQKIIDLEDQFCDALQEIDTEYIVGHCFHGAMCWTTNTLLLKQVRNFPIYTYDQVSLNPESLFNYCGNYTVLLDHANMCKPMPRLKTPEMPDFRKALQPWLDKVITPKMIDGLNLLAPSDITFVR